MIYTFDNRDNFNNTYFVCLYPSDSVDLLYYQSGSGGSGTNTSNVVLFKYILTSNDISNKQFQLPYTVSDTNDVFFSSPVGATFISGVDFDIVNNQYINWINYSTTAEILTVGIPIIVVYYRT